MASGRMNLFFSFPILSLPLPNLRLSGAVFLHHPLFSFHGRNVVLRCPHFILSGLRLEKPFDDVDKDVHSRTVDMLKMMQG